MEKGLGFTTIAELARDFITKKRIINRRKRGYSVSEYKVVFHIDELSKWKILLTNVSNLLNGIDNKKFQIEVLANAEAVKYYDTTQDLDADFNTMEVLNNRGIEFIACNNALMANRIEKNNIIHFVNIVPAGVLELVEKQSEGFAYIKP